MTKTRKITLCAMCVALCYILPLLFHGIGLGGTLSPMHIPVLLCGLICGGGYGIVCGIAGPMLSSLLSGMPTAVMLLRMIPELAVYGCAAGYAIKHIPTNHITLKVYLSLVLSMSLGRIAGGLASAIFYTVTTGVYSLGLWLTSYFLESIPGIILHLILVPGIYFTLSKAKLITVKENEYEQSKNC